MICSCRVLASGVTTTISRLPPAHDMLRKVKGKEEVVSTDSMMLVVVFVACVVRLISFPISFFRIKNEYEIKKN